jgi:DNA-binding CsgD family transcriptional regulator
VPGGTLSVEQSKKYAGLTAREQAVARLAADGLSNKAIARELGLHVGTVKVHMHSIFQKMRIKARMALIATAKSPIITASGYCGVVHLGEDERGADHSTALSGLHHFASQ